MEIKTLKEINEEHLQSKGYYIFPPQAIKILRQNAINHIKALVEKSKPEPGEVTKQFIADQQACFDQIAWITDFYSITDKELEDGHI